VRTVRMNGTVETRYFHQDALGSIAAVTDEWGRVEKRFTFDAWGKRVNTVDTHSGSGGKVTRGFTDHEMLDDFGLIHMNGRVYDPVLGRFLSADSYVQDAGDSQSYNRYSYVSNNPLNSTDPSGHTKCKEILPTIIAVVVTAVVIVCTAGAGAPAAAGFWSQLGYGLANMTLTAAMEAGAAGGFASGFSGSMLNGGSVGDAFRAGVTGAAWGAASGAVAYGVGQYFDSMYPTGTAGSDMTDPLIEGGRALAHGVSQGGLVEAQGGQFRHGFYAAFASSAAGSLGNGFLPGGHSPGAIAERTAFAAMVGGTASRLGGGKFANGAMTGAFEHLFNQEAEPDADSADLAEAEEERIEDEIAEMEARYGIVRMPGNTAFRTPGTDSQLDEAAEAAIARGAELRRLMGPFDEVTGQKLSEMRSQFEAIRPALWRREAELNSNKYTIDQLDAMRAGRTPIGWDGRPMEIHHFVALQYGGANVWSNFRFLTFTEHRSPVFFSLNHPNLNQPSR